MTIKRTPIFFLSSERSGTNLLKKRLNEWQSTAFGSSPAHFLKHLFYNEPYYGDLSKDINFKELISDALKLCYIHFSPWNIKFNLEDIFYKYKETHGNLRNSILLSDLLMTEYAKSNGYSTYFCKDNFLFDYAFQIVSCIPDAKFIYLHRDPRDYALSQLKRSVMTSNLYRIAQLWRDEQIKCIRIIIDPLFKDRIISISYENFILNEWKLIKKICNSFRLRINKAKKIDAFEASKTEEWKNIDKPTIKNNFNKFEREMRTKQIKIVESICWNQMLYLGYKPKSDHRPQIIKFHYFLSDLSYSLIDRIKLKTLRKKSDFKKYFIRSDFLNKLRSKTY